MTLKFLKHKKKLKNSNKIPINNKQKNLVVYMKINNYNKKHVIINKLIKNNLQNNKTNIFNNSINHQNLSDIYLGGNTENSSKNNSILNSYSQVNLRQYKIPSNSSDKNINKY